MPSTGGGSDQLPAGNIGETAFDGEILPSSLAEIAPILRVGDEVEQHNPRVAYLCRFYAFEKAQKLDPTSRGQGVHRFKTALLQRLEREKDPILMGKVEGSDAKKMQSFYERYYKKYIQALQNAAEKADRAQLSKAYQTANVLFKVLKTVNLTQSLEVDHEIMEIHNKVAEKTEIYAPYNILPLDPDSANQPIMRFSEIQLQLLLFKIREGFHGRKNTRKNKTKTFLIGFRQCLDSRKIMLQIKESISFYYLLMHIYGSFQNLLTTRAG